MVSANLVRGYLRSLSRRRTDRTITVDDAQRFMTNRGVSESARKVRSAIISEVFPNRNVENFKAVGKRPSSRPAARRRLVTEWRYTG